jgi:GDPmannose 4,6-dehydratase
MELDYSDYVETDPAFLRPAEVHHLMGDYSLAKRELGWQPKVSFEELVEMMVREDLNRLRNSSAPQNHPEKLP